MKAGYISHEEWLVAGREPTTHSPLVDKPLANGISAWAGFHDEPFC